MEKLSKTARILNRIVKVLRGISIGFGIACMILLLIAVFLPDSQYHRLISSGNMDIDLGGITLHLSQSLEPIGSIRLPVCITLLTAAVSLGISAAGLHLLYRILLPMSQQQPFDGTVSSNLRKLALITLVGVVAFDILQGVSDVMTIRLFDLHQLFAPGMVSGYTINHVTDLSLLLVPVLLFLLSYVFQYGEELQKQSDETL